MGRLSGSGPWLTRALKLLALSVLLLFPTAFAGAEPGKAKLSPDLEERIRAVGADDLMPVIIETADQPSSGHLARLHGRGGSVKAAYVAIHGYAARVPAGQLQALAEDPEILHISHDSPVRANLDVAYQAAKADAALGESGGLDGSGVGVAVIDTGVAGHVDLLRPKGSPQVIEVEVVGHEAGLADYFGHGTHVAGIIAGNGTASSDRYSFRSFKGLAPGVQIISIRALYPDGTGFTSDILSAIDWAIAYRTSFNIRVLNLSLGHPVYESYRTDPLCLAVRKAFDNGILVVAAAGNSGGVGSGFGTINSPGNEPTTLTVGATDDGNTVTTTDDTLAWYSSKGPSLIDFVVKPDLVAPGTAVISLRVPNSYLDTAFRQLTLRLPEYKDSPGSADKLGDYYELSGTSMAAPFVSATAALLFQKDPSLTPATVKARLMESATKDHRLVFETGAGTLDAQAALKAVGNAQSAPSPIARVAADGSIQVEDTSLIWGIRYTTSLIWSGGRIGDRATVDNNMITSSGLIWSGERSSLLLSTDAVESLSAIWTTGGKKR